ncbi:Por secretion system C-terminal sorting domain-containing protein [Flavobacteriaceae bacterium MAR_2010_188]|nr:Por secretion system C-terminal sorting domain-containing protein [Flavobacteriaceae bacterium MAR_2010_188]
MAKNLLLLLVITISYFSYGQQDAWVFLKDKQNVANAVANPNTILSQRAIDRKNRHGISIDARDVPVTENYISQLKTQSGITVYAKSKWMNAVHVRGTEAQIRALTSLNFVDFIDFADKNLANAGRVRQQENKFSVEDEQVTFNYGLSENQVSMLNVDLLHENNYTGEGICIAVLDSGFPNIETLAAFERLRNNGDYLGGYDFPNRTSDLNVAVDGDHGVRVLSTMAAYLDGQYVGTAPDASYYLFRTEIGPSENPVEESYWVEAAERADSLGVNIINSSLGYTQYDNPNYSYTPSDMDGKSAYITRGANIAAEKGILVVNSAGNEGNSSWGIVGAPADGPGVFSIAAVTPSGNYASFSSKGSAIQPTQKPDVAAQGAPANVITSSGALVSNNGTSFSSPIMAGSIASLWQSMPDVDPETIKRLVRESSSQFNNPDFFIGYGIPDMSNALNALLSTKDKYSLDLRIFPNPVSSFLTLQSSKSLSNSKIVIYNVLGTKVKSQNSLGSSNKIDVTSLANGVYLLKITLDNNTKTFKFIKS